MAKRRGVVPGGLAAFAAAKAQKAPKPNDLANMHTLPHTSMTMDAARGTGKRARPKQVKMSMKLGGY